MEPSLSHDATNSSCFSGILRRLLCSGAHPTHPSDTVVNGSTQPHFNCPHDKSGPATPGIVARLMGLDSLPAETTHSSFERRTTLESILRSRSVNSLNYVPEFDLLNPASASQHRRAKTSVSFREIPTFVNEPNRDFLVLCFERVGESHETRLSQRKSDMGLGLETEIKQRKWVTEKTERKDVFPHRRNRDAVKAKSSEEKLVKKRRKKMKKKKRADVRKSETVSVLPHVSKTVTSPETKLPEIRSRKPVSSSRRSSRKNELEFDEYPCQNYYSSSRTLISPEIDEEDSRVKAKEAWDENHVKLIEQIRSLSEEHVDRDYQWAAKRLDEEVEEICNEFGQQLLDHMIQQVVDELVRIWPDYNSS